MLLRELGVDPADVAAEAGLDLTFSRNPEIRSPSPRQAGSCRRARCGRDARISAFWSGSDLTREAWDSSVD